MKTEWYKLSIKETFERLKTKESGLTEEQANID